MRWVGHYLEGVGATVGEEQEQVNASLALYRNKTVHMTEESKNIKTKFTFLISVNFLKWLFR